MKRPSDLTKDLTSVESPKSLFKKLQARKVLGNFRTLNPSKKTVDFYSNDYLGFSTSGLLKNLVLAKNFELPFWGSTGSRLLSGDSEFVHHLEKKIAIFHHSPSALIFNCGFIANLGLIGSLPTRFDTVIYDELCHASIIDGARYSLAKKKFSFKHNQLDDLEKKINNASGNIFVVTESVFSMDGDFAELGGISELCFQKGAYLIVDEAHATGIYGKNGAGLVNELALEDKVFARVITFGKALGAHGAAVLGGSELKNYLINFCRPLIYSTSLDYATLMAIDCAYELLPEAHQNLAPLFILVHEFQSASKKELSQKSRLNSLSPIQGIVFGNNQRCYQAMEVLSKANINAKAILSPTVSKGKERIRICLHTFNSTSEIQLLFYELKTNRLLLE